MATNKFTEQDKRRLMSREATKHNGQLPDGSVALVAQRRVDKEHHEAAAKPAPRRSGSKR